MPDPAECPIAGPADTPAATAVRGTPEQPAVHPAVAAISAVIAATASVAACGGGGTEPPAPAAAPSPAPVPAPAPSPAPSPAPAAIDTTQAARFLHQAAFAASDAHIARVQQLGFSGWLDEQTGVTGTPGHWDWLVANGYAVTANLFNFRGVDNSIWRKLLGSPDVLRQRVALAYSEIFVVSMAGLPVRWRGLLAANYLDLLSAHAFSNFRTLLEAVTLAPAMGVYLNMRGNQKEDAATGRQPDENYAREVMQLFTIGLVQLNADGSPRTDAAGKPLETYSNEDIAGLAKVLTGWDFSGTTSPDDYAYTRNPMAFLPARHSTAEKRFLGTVIRAGSTDGPGELRQALDTLFLHPNVGPFIGRQLIQRWVTSNPSAAYVGRVAAAFANNGQGVRGDMRAVIKAVLLDAEARTTPDAPGAGRLREPVERLVQWARTFGATAPSSGADSWTVGDTSNPATRLGQSPLRSASVFNFFRPGYVPPNTEIGRNQLVAPEFQITNESTVVAYANYLQGVIANGAGDVRTLYPDLLPLASDPAALFDRLNLQLAAGRLSPNTRATLTGAVGSMPANTDAQRRNRVYASVLLAMTCPEYLVAR